jgi:hypothetical protein
MQKIKLLLIMSIFIGLTGCGGDNIKPTVKTSEKFKIDTIALTVSQRVTPDIKYHTEAEIKNLVIEKITTLLKNNNLLTTAASANSLNIDIKYKRNFVGDATPFPSDSLAYPHFDYQIKVLDNAKEITNISKIDLAFSGGLLMNLEVIAGSLREKSDEVIFIDTLAETIVNAIKEIELKK